MSSRSILWPCWTVNHNVPWSSVMIVCGSPPDGVLCSVTLPVTGSRWPMVPLPLPVYQTCPDLSTSSPCGRAPGGTPFLERPGARIEPRNLVAEHHGDEDRAVGRGSGVARELGRRHRPFRDLAL